MNSYFAIFVFGSVALILGCFLYSISYFFVTKTYDTEKISAYECGFDPFTDISAPFDVRYYLVSILFIIFDLEVSFLFPWSITFLYLGLFGYLAMIIFLFVLTVGFVYEWLNGALDWEV